MSDAATVRYDTRLLGHPVGLLVLFFTELWERFSYYGMRAILILYLVAAVQDGGLGVGVVQAGAIYGLYTSGVYLAGLPGGWLADRLLGQRRAVLIGGSLIAAGHFSIAIPSTASFFAGLGLIIAGTGLLKPNISTIVGQLYAPGDERRDAGFTFFYMGINFGALFGPLACGYLGERVSWHYGFGAAGVGMVLGLVLFVVFRRSLGHAGGPPALPAPEAAAVRRRAVRGAAILGVLVAVGVTPVALGLVDVARVADAFGVVLTGIALAFFVWLFTGIHWTREERGRLIVIVVLFVAAAIFWAGYEQAGSSLNLFAANQTDRTLGGEELPASFFQSVPAFYVLVLSVVFTILWTVLGRRQPSSPAKFALGLIMLGLGFVVMVVASTRAAGGALVGPEWLLATYLLHVIGEMCLSPIGLSAVTKLAPERVTSLMMGVWFLAASVGSYLAGRAAGLTETVPLPTLFGGVAAVALISGVVLMLFVPRIRRLMGSVR